MSSHLHLVLSDPEVELPLFMHALDLAIAKSMNAQLDRRENFWKQGSYDCITLEDDEAILSSIVYTLMNPVAASLVPHGDQWPGLRSRARDLVGRHIVAKKAGRYFMGDSRAPELAEFDLVRPPVCTDLTDAQLIELLRQRIEEQEAMYREKVAAEKRKFLGKKRVLALPPTTVATTPEPLGQLNPRVAAGHRDTRIAAIKQLRAFLDAYREAFERYVDYLKRDFRRAREVIFPAGTYLMSVRHSVQCQAPP